MDSQMDSKLEKDILQYETWTPLIDVEKRIAVIFHREWQYLVMIKIHGVEWSNLYSVDQ